jgi:catechol 2,3-dioxygenase-like lactoylglutathione lyase family enzyme
MREECASASPRPRNLSHLAIGVSDMERSLGFYRDVIGLHLAVDKMETMTRPEFRTRRRGCYLRWRDGDDESFIILDQTLEPTEDRGAAKKLFDIGVHHFGFWVDDVDATVARARAAGHDVRLDPIDADSGGYGEAPGRPIRVAMLRDPDGNHVQIDQRCDG